MPPPTKSYSPTTKPTLQLISEAIQITTYLAVILAQPFSSRTKVSNINVNAHCSCHVLASRPLRPNVTSSIKLEVHNVLQRRYRRTEPRPQGLCVQNFVKIGRAVPEICSWTDRQTNRQRK